MSLNKDNLFEDPIYNQNDINKLPIILFDNSSSTANKFLDGKNIFQSYSIITTLLEQKGIDSFRMMLWSDKVKIIEGILSIDKLSLALSKFGSSGGTYLNHAFNNIPKSWLENESNDIYIVTDGEVNDRSDFLTNSITTFIENNKNTNIYIITFEANNKDYYKHGCNVTNILYDIIQKNNLTNHIKQYLSYNRVYHDVPFINFSDIKLVRNYVQFKDKCFHIDNLRKFIKYIDNIVANINDVNMLNNLLFNCCSTIHQIAELKPDIKKDNIIELFARIFSTKLEYSNVINKISNQVNKIKHGCADSYNLYISNKKKLFEITKKSLNNSVSKSITTNNEGFLSILLPLKKQTTHKYQSEYVMLCASNLHKLTSYNIDNFEYSSAAINIGAYAVPIVPDTTNITDSNVKQYIRQWLYAIYSNYYGFKANSDILLYMFLTDMLKVILSNVKESVKMVYRNLGFLMLDRVYFNTGMKEIVYLHSDKPPLPNSRDSNEMRMIFESCSAKAFGINSISAFTLWYAIVLALNDKKLVENQLQFCQKDIAADFGDINASNLLVFLSTKYSIKCTLYDINDCVDLEYICYLTLDDTSLEGGYKILSHQVTNQSKALCDPKYVITKEAYDSFKENRKMICPICMKKLTTNDYIVVGPKETKENVVNTADNIGKDINGKILDWFRKDYEDIVSPTKMIFNIMKNGYDSLQFKNTNLLAIDDLDFMVKTCKFTDNMIVKSLENNNISVKTSYEFTNLVSKSHSFLKTFNWKNMCIAGGYIKSILLCQPVNDIDIFFYGIDNNEIINKVKEIIKNLQECFSNKYILLANKKDTQVIEILIIDILDVDSDYDELLEKDSNQNNDCNQNNDNHDKSSKNYYFEQLNSGNTSPEILQKFKVLHKVQLITKQNKDIYDIINNFDLISCMAAYDGVNLVFNEQGYLSYKYMFNVVKKNYSYVTLCRLIKYYDYGFNIASHKYKKIGENAEIYSLFDFFKITFRGGSAAVNLREITGYEKDGFYFSNGLARSNIIEITKLTLNKSNDNSNNNNDNNTTNKQNTNNGYYGSITGFGTDKALITLIRYAEIKNKIEDGNIIWKIFSITKNSNIIHQFLEHMPLRIITNI